jgi:hypothetical protein
VTRICVDLDLGPDLYDASPRQAITADYGEDYGRWEGDHPFPAQRWLARVLDGAEPLWGYAPLDENGCTGASADVEYDHPTDLTIEIAHWAYWETGDRSIVGYTCSDMFSDPNCTFALERQITGVSAVSGGTTWATASGAFGLRNIDYPTWSGAFCEERLPLNTEFETYLLSDSEATPQQISGAGTLLGGAPTVVIKGIRYQSKFNTCHETGHIQASILAGFTQQDLDYTYDPSAPGTPATSEHVWTSSGPWTEWQSAAATEAFGSMYAVWAWSDIDGAGSVPFVLTGGDEDTYLAVEFPPSPAACFEDPNDPAYHLADGASNQANWIAALREFRTNASATPSAAVVFGMLARARDGSWVASGQTSDFWDNFVDELHDPMDPMNSWLSSSQLADWEDAAAAWCIDH